MKHRSYRAVVLAAAMALLLALGGSAVAAKPAKTGLKTGVNKVKGGTTTLAVDAGSAAALAGAGISVTEVAPATVPTAGSFAFPITGGKLVYHKTKKAGSKSKSKKRLSGYVTHSGGITLTKDTTLVTLSNLRINLSANKTGRIDAEVANTKLALAKLSNVTLNATNKQISATATLTSTAVQALNATFGTNLTGTVPLGTVLIAPTF